MPHDKNGQEIKAGDRVTVECEVVSVCAGEFCTTELRTVEVMPGNGQPTTISAINAKQVVKLGLMFLALVLFAAPAAAAERPPAFPTPPAFPSCGAPGCTCVPCTCDPCDCLARAAVLLAVGVTADVPATTEQRLAALEREVTELKAKLARANRSGPDPFPSSSAGITTEEITTPDGGRKIVRVEGRNSSAASGRYVTRQVCNGGSCQLVQEWVPEAPAVVQAAGRTYGDHFIDTDQQGGGAAPSGGGGCAGGSCGVRSGLFGNAPVLRINGGPGVIRSVFGCR